MSEEEDWKKYVDIAYNKHMVADEFDGEFVSDRDMDLIGDVVCTENKPLYIYRVVAGNKTSYAIFFEGIVNSRTRKYHGVMSGSPGSVLSKARSMRMPQVTSCTYGIPYSRLPKEDYYRVSLERRGAKLYRYDVPNVPEEQESPPPKPSKPESEPNTCAGTILIMFILSAITTGYAFFGGAL